MIVKVWKVLPGSGEARLQPLTLPGAADTLDGVSAQLPGGAYTTLRTYQGSKVLRLGEHLRRLQHTADLAGYSYDLDVLAMRLALRQVVQGAGAQGDLRIRLTVDLEVQLGVFYIAAHPLETPRDQDYRDGVRAITCNLQRLTPEAKLTRFIARADRVRHSLPPGINEAIMVDSEGRFLEGLSSNFFAVKDGVLWTAAQGVLSGVTRALVLESAAQSGIPVRMQAARVAELDALQEAFITSSSRGVMPVVQIDQARIGAGQPGSITLRMMAAYAACIARLVEEI